MDVGSRSPNEHARLYGDILPEHGSPAPEMQPLQARHLHDVCLEHDLCFLSGSLPHPAPQTFQRAGVNATTTTSIIDLVVGSRDTQDLLQHSRTLPFSSAEVQCCLSDHTFLLATLKWHHAPVRRHKQPVSLRWNLRPLQRAATPSLLRFHTTCITPRPRHPHSLRKPA